MTIAVSIAPSPILAFLNNQGQPCVGGTVLTQVGGVNYPTYQDSAGVIPLPNPIPLNNRGEISNASGVSCQLFLDEAAIYTFTLFDANGNQLNQAQYVVPSANALVAFIASIASSIGASLIGFIQAGIGAVLRTVQSKLRESVSTADFGAVADGVTSDAVAVANANTRAASIGSQLLLQGVHYIGSPVTITAPIVDTLSQIFAATSQVTIDNGLPVRPEWFGSAAGNIRLAVNALPAAGGTVLLEKNTYPPSFNTITPAKVTGGTAAAGVDYLARTGVKLLGRKLPNYKTPVAGVVDGMEGGTIIQGPFYVQASNFEIDNIGVDSGPAVCTALYGGAAQDGFVMVQSNQVAPTFLGGLRVGRVMGLCNSINAAFHACLFEAVADGTIQEATGAQAFHGVVIKSKNIQADLLRGIGNSGEGVLCKSDTYAPLGFVKINQVEASSISAGVETGHGFICDAVTASASSVQVGIVRVLRKANGCTVRSNGANLMTDVQIGELTTEGCFIGTLLTGDIRRVSIDSAVVNNATYGAQVETNVTSPTVSIGTLKVTNAQYGVYLGGKLSLANLEADTLSGAAINYYDVGARIILGTFRLNAVTGGIWNQQPALAGTWVNEGTAGNPTFNANQLSGRVCLSGWIKGGGAAALTTITTPTRPLTNRVWKAPGRNGATEVTVTIRLDATSGALTCPDYATASSYISLDGIEWDAPQ